MLLSVCTGGTETVPPLQAFLFLFRKKKMGVAEEAIPITVKNIRLMFFTGSWEIASQITTVLIPTAWTMSADPQSCGIVHKASAEAASASQSARLPQAIPPPLWGGE